ncbi:PAQR family membrane homeostasis protein TrhA [Marihabitans asiaticum]|uniref:PAQR family membrane homeostasis protein TrhA n=1 Tax=Marihabitans asiaticum TaxID=415218 RepID=UPI0011A7F647|nr:hemolysin III family protein [Marihabitans asiaticum]
MEAEGRRRGGRARAVRERATDARERAHDVASDVQNQVDELVDAVKPHLRGWLHLVMAPLALVGGMLLMSTAPTREGRIAAFVFTLTAGLLFTTSAVYHRGRWGDRLSAVLRRWDHANIFLIIAGSYTPFALLLPREQAITLLTIVWSGAIVGVLFRVFWIGAPRWLYVPVYVALGWVAVFYIRPLLTHGGLLIMSLVVLGGLFYSIGALVYGLKRPNPSPRWFGFHEIFHAFTILAFATHFVAAALALFGPIAQGS